MTDEHGDYLFPPMPHGGAYTIEPLRNSEHKKGVSTLDLITLQKHLLGIRAMDNPYTIIAADANRSGTLSAMDIVVLRRLILGLIDTLPNNTSWRFVDAAYEFASETNPLQEAFPGVYEINPLIEDMKVDFVGIKVGDLNGSVMNDLQEDAILSRQAPGSISLLIDDKQLVDGESVLVQVTSKMLESVEGAQFELAWDADLLECIPVQGQAMLNEAHWNNKKLVEGRLPVSWTRYDAETSNDVLLTLQVTARSNILLSDADLRIAHEGIAAEGQLEGGDIFSPKLVIRPVSDVDDALVVYQNRPNPFTHKTVIPFVLPDQDLVKLEVFDVNGSLVHQAEFDGRKGYNEMMLDASIFEASGLYTYRVSTATTYRTLRMIVVGE